MRLKIEEGDFEIVKDTDEMFFEPIFSLSCFERKFELLSNHLKEILLRRQCEIEALNSLASRISYKEPKR